MPYGSGSRVEDSGFRVWCIGIVRLWVCGSMAAGVEG